VDPRTRGRRKWSFVSCLAGLPFVLSFPLDLDPQKELTPLLLAPFYSFLPSKSAESATRTFTYPFHRPSLISSLAFTS